MLLKGFLRKQLLIMSAVKQKGCSHENSLLSDTDKAVQVVIITSTEWELVIGSLIVVSRLSLSCGQRMCAAQHGLKEARQYVQHCTITAHNWGIQGPWLCGLPASPCAVVFRSATPGCLEVPLYCAYAFCCYFTAFKQYLADFDVFCDKVFRD